MRKLFIFVLLFSCAFISVSLSSNFDLDASSTGSQTYPLAANQNIHNEIENKDFPYPGRINNNTYRAEYLQLKHVCSYGYCDYYNAYIQVNGMMNRTSSYGVIDSNDVYMIVLKEYTNLSVSLYSRNSSDIRQLSISIINENFTSDPSLQPDMYSMIDQRIGFKKTQTLKYTALYNQSKSTSINLSPGLYYIQVNYPGNTTSHIYYNLTVTANALVHTYFSSSQVKALKTTNPSAVSSHEVVYLKNKNYGLDSLFYSSAMASDFNKTGYANMLDMSKSIYDHSLIPLIAGVTQPQYYTSFTDDHLIIYDLNEWVNFHFYIYRIFMNIEALRIQNQIDIATFEIITGTSINALLLIPELSLLATMSFFATTIQSMLDLYNVYYPDPELKYFNVLSDEVQELIHSNPNLFTLSTNQLEEDFDHFMQMFSLPQFADNFELDTSNYHLYNQFMHDYLKQSDIDLLLLEFGQMLTSFYNLRLSLNQYINDNIFYAYMITLEKIIMGPRVGVYRQVNSFRYQVYTETPSMTLSTGRFHPSSPYNLKFKSDYGIIYGTVISSGTGYVCDPNSSNFTICMN
jgi:hypothetical protein